MTRKEFVKVKLAIEGERFEPKDFGPLTYGIQRSLFEQHKLEKLICAAEKVDGKTAQAQAARWKRKLQKIQRSQVNLEKLRKEIHATQVDGIAVQLAQKASHLRVAR